MGIGDWGLGIGDWGLGPIPTPPTPIPNPQCPTNPHTIYISLNFFYLKKFKSKIKNERNE